MRKLSIIAVFCVLAGALSAEELRIVNAASLSSVSLSPGSIFTIFGTNLAAGVTYAPNAQTPPTTLGGATVTIGGAAASLFYVSPTQINGVINPMTPLGTETVTVTSSRGTQTGSVNIALLAPPGLFSLFGTGTRDGAVLNAITFLLGDFSTKTANSPTYLAIFATGLSLSVVPTVTIGGVSVPVVFYGAAPCCMGLQQINVMLTDSLAGAGRVPVVVAQGAQLSNTVHVVLLPPPNARQSDDEEENKTRSRELASIAYVPGTSLVLVTDENDDVVRVVDVSAGKVTRVIALHDGANPTGIAVNSSGSTAVVAEAGRGRIAIINLNTFSIVTEIQTGPGSISVAMAGPQAVVVNKDNDTVSVVDVTGQIVQKTVTVGRGPEAAAIDAMANLAYVTNEDDGTISVISLTTMAVTNTIKLGASVRPHAIALITSGVALVTSPASGADGAALLVNLATGTTIATISANPDRSGGSSDVVYFAGKLYFANQAGGSVSVLPVNPMTGAATGPVTTIKADLGARALAIDTKDNMLVVSNEGSGTLVLVRLSDNTIAGRINAVRTNMQGDDGKDDHSDHDAASNLPAIQSLSPSSARAGTSFALTINGANFTGATAILFDSPGSDDKGKGKDSDNDDGKKNGSGITVTDFQVASGGTKITALVTIAAGTKPGGRVARVTTPNGTSSSKGDGAMFVVMQ